MADKKITELTAATETGSSDLMIMVDISDTADSTAGTTKKITFDNFIKRIGIFQEITASTAITGNLVALRSTTAIAATLAAPSTAGLYITIVNTSTAGTAAHTVTCPAGVTWDGTNKVATLDAPDEALHCVSVSSVRWYVITNNGAVAFST